MMRDVGEIKASISINNGEMILTISENERMKLIRRLAVNGKAYVDESGNMDVFFDLGEDVCYDSGEEEDKTAMAPMQEYNEEDFTSEEETGEVIELYHGFVEDEIDITGVVDTEEESGRRSIKELTKEEMDNLVDLYIAGVPNDIIFESENVTKSALYSSLERERIPRVGKLNTILRRIDDKDSIVSISNEEDVSIEVINRIIDSLIIGVD